MAQVHHDSPHPSKNTKQGFFIISVPTAKHQASVKKAAAKVSA
ncbi:protein of unknown function [Xenorhabdus bovienii]|uniref:Uncharacterized protein n=1 Tax=Xenorhabdus bovienii TaxID=40576 RepID=A0A0B6X750_XENBV|nr:protein of unknown function [Xenorhabdus bovienii]